MFKFIAIVVVALILALLGYAYLQPDDFRVQRSIQIQAAPDKIFPLIDNLHDWTRWSPYEKLDPAAKKTFTGPDSGPGAAYAWDGNRQAGQGRMEIAEVEADAKILIKLDFTRPFEAHDNVEFTLKPSSDGTTVSWVMVGPSPYPAKLMGVFVNMDHMIGGDFETGLASLKTLAESH